MRALFDENGTKPSELSQKIGLTRGAISKLLFRLASKDFVVIRSDSRDGRAQVVTLSSSGRRLVPKLAAAADENDAEMFGHLSRQQQTKHARHACEADGNETLGLGRRKSKRTIFPNVMSLLYRSGHWCTFKSINASEAPTYAQQVGEGLTRHTRPRGASSNAWKTWGFQRLRIEWVPVSIFPWG